MPRGSTTTRSTTPRAATATTCSSPTTPAPWPTTPAATPAPTTATSTLSTPCSPAKGREGPRRGLTHRAGAGAQGPGAGADVAGGVVFGVTDGWPLPPWLRFRSGVSFWSNGRMIVLLLGELTRFFSARMYWYCRYSGVSWACEHSAIGFGTTV